MSDSNKKVKHTSLSDIKRRRKKLVRCTKAVSPVISAQSEESANPGSSSPISHMENPMGVVQSKHIDPTKEPASETRLSDEEALVNELLRIVQSNDTTSLYYNLIKDIITEAQAFDLAFQTVMMEAKQESSGTLVEMNNTTQTEVLFRRIAKLRTLDKIVLVSGLAPFRDEIMSANIESTFGAKKKTAMDDLMEHLHTHGGNYGTPKANKG